MLDKMREFADNLTFFDSVSFFDDQVLQKNNTASIFLERVQYEPLTFSRIRSKATMSIIFRTDGDGTTALNTAEQRLSQISQVLANLFASFLLQNVQFAYVSNLKSLFCYVIIEVEEG